MKGKSSLASRSKDNSAVHEFARTYSRKTSMEGTNGKAGFGSGGLDSLNPYSEKFNAREWATNLVKINREAGQSFRQIGLCFQNLNVFGYGTPTDFQKDVGNVWLALPGMVRRLFSHTAGQTRINILREFNGIICPGEMCVVLGPPGSGCSTLLKTLSGEINGIYVDKVSFFNYQRISPGEMHTAHRGDCIYTAEVDVHFPHLTVGETLTFASRARCPRELPQGITCNE